MIASERRLYILRAIHERGVINLKEVAQAVGTSEATIRRDLEKLERESKLVRVQGGAARSGDAGDLLGMSELAMQSKVQEEMVSTAAVCAFSDST